VCGLNTFTRGVQKAAKNLEQVPGSEKIVLLTVARPRGVFTRFPILPRRAGTQSFLLGKSVNTFPVRDGVEITTYVDARQGLRDCDPESRKHKSDS